MSNRNIFVKVASQNNPKFKTFNSNLKNPAK